MSYNNYNDELPDMNNQAGSSEDIVTFVGKLQRVVFPKSPIILGTEGHNRGITGWSVESTIEGSVETNKYGNVSVKGNFYFVLDDKIPYKIMARRVVDPNYGTQYELIYINENQDMSILSNQKAFLKTILTDRQIEELYKVYDNPLEIIANQDVEALKKAKGIGDYLADKIIEKYNDKKDWSTVYVEMDHFGLSPGIIEKLKKAYSTPARVLEKLRTNPYSLVYEVEGIGFLTADKIAVKSGLNPKGVKRIKEYIRYYLYEQGSEGNSYVTSSELTTAIYNFFEGKENILVVRTDEEGNVVGNNIGDAINQLVKDGVIGIEDNVNRSRRRVYSMKYYNLEKNIAKELHRIMKGPNYFNYSDWKEKIKRLEKEQGFEFTDEQLAGIKLGLDSKVCIITGSAGCVDCDTEFFNGKEWKKISDYTSGDKVLQYNLDGTANLVKPLDYIKLPADYLWHFETKYGLDQTLSEEHRILYITQKGFLHETNIKTIKERRESESSGWYGRFLTTFKYDGPGIDLTDDEIRLMVAVIADGSFTENNTNYCRFHIKKERKKERLKMLAKKANIEIEERESAAEGYNDYILYPPRKEKEYTEYWYSCSNHQLKIICDEVMYWDGHKSTTKKGVNKACFSTSSKKSADFIQFAFSATENKRASLQTFDRRGQINKKTNKKEYERKSIEYEVITTNRKYIGICADNRANHKKTKIEQVPTIDGYKYCFTVPSSYLVLRRNNKIFITGNSGKSSLVSGILRSLSNYTFAQCALSGQAAARLQEVTGEDGMTIHRLLGYNPSNAHDEYNGFACNEDCPLEYDIIILDEISMVGGEIFYSLLKAIPDNAKLIMLGDTGQLESVGSLNLAHDMMESGAIPTVKLTKVHRQAQKSGILTSSYDVRNNIQLFPNAFEGTDVRGELQDMFFDVAQRRDDFLEKIIDYFEDIYNGELVNQNIMDIQVLTPVKERGATSVMELNRAIQGIVNPVDPSDGTPKITVKHKKNDEDRTYYIHANDKVMCIKNNYKMSDVLGNPAPVYNGWTGIVKDMTEEQVFVQFPFYRHPVIFAMEDARKYLILGYASTVHKCVTGDSEFFYCMKDKYGKMAIKDVTQDMIGKLEVWNGEYYEKPNAFYSNIPLPTIKVTTESGFSISGLYDHRVYVNGIVKELSQLHIGDFLICCYNPMCVPFKDKIVKIEDAGLQSTYCFNMPETHSFIVNGVYSLNCQGSGFKAIIGVIDYSTPPSMLTCQLVYTLITRAKKLCVLVAQNGALRTAIANNFVSIKRTFLQEFLNAS